MNKIVKSGLLIISTATFIGCSTSAPVSVEEKIRCEEFGKENYKDMYMDDGWITFEYYYSPVLETCVLQREEMGPEPHMLVFKLYDMFTKEILLYYATFEGIGCAMAKECVDSLNEYTERKEELLGM